MGDGQGWAEEEVIETRTNGSNAMSITIEKFREALKAEYKERGIVYGCRCSAAAIAVLEKLLADEPQPRELTVGEIDTKWSQLVREADGWTIFSIEKLVRWAIAESRPAVCGPTAEEVKAVLDGPLKEEIDALKTLVKEHTEIRMQREKIELVTEVTAPLEKRIAELKKEVEEWMESYRTLSLEATEDRLTAATADKPCMTEKDMRAVVADAAKVDTTKNCILAGVRGRPESYHAGVQNTIDALAGHVADKPPCYTVEAMRKVVASGEKNELISRDIRLGVEGMEKSSLRACQNTIRALAGHVADQTAEIERQHSVIVEDYVKIELLRCAVAKWKDLADDRGQTICHLQTCLSKYNQTTPERLEYFQKSKKTEEELRKVIACQAGLIISFGRCVKILGGNMPEVKNEEKPEPKDEWPKYVVSSGLKSITNLRRLDGPDEAAVFFGFDGAESGERLIVSKKYFSESRKRVFPSIPTAEAEAMIAEAKERAKPTERWYTDDEQSCLWVYRDDGTSEVWGCSGMYYSPSTDSEYDGTHIRISKTEADTIRAGWEKKS